jgi:hypothetical protein
MLARFITPLSKGVIEPDSNAGKEIGFTSDLFEGYLWLDRQYICISFIESKKPRQGNFSQLCKNILRLGYGIKVPTPFQLMECICVVHGFKKTEEWFKEANAFTDVYTLPPNSKWQKLEKNEAIRRLREAFAEAREELK